MLLIPSFLRHTINSSASSQVCAQWYTYSAILNSARPLHSRMPGVGKVPWESSGSDLILAESTHQILETVRPPRSLWEHNKWLPFVPGFTVLKILGVYWWRGPWQRERKKASRVLNYPKLQFAKDLLSSRYSARHLQLSSQMGKEQESQIS